VVVTRDEGPLVRVGTVVGCGLSPLKGAAHAHPDRILVRRLEVLGDRRWAFIESRRGDLRVMRTVEVPAIMTVRAQIDAEGGLRMDLPGGRFYFVPSPEGPTVPADYWGRRVRVRPAPGPWDAALSSLLGREVELAAVEQAGSVVYAEPVSVVTTSSLRELAQRAGLTRIDAERFRSTIVVDTGGLPPFVEQTWVGGRLRVGGVDLLVRRELARCAVIGFEPGGGQRPGPDLLHLLAADRTNASGIVFGVGADVGIPGEITVGTGVELLVHGSGEMQ
jgi:uncharacterized protein YcbX